MKLSIENIEAHNKAKDELADTWRPLMETIAQAIVDHPTRYAYITDTSDVQVVGVTISESWVFIEFTDLFGDSETLVTPVEAINHPGGIAGYENERIVVEKAAKEREAAEREQRDRADMLETISRALVLHDFTPEELNAAVAKASK